jgi:RNA polymerase sigma-70 factor (ECF subfamily)
MTKEEFKTYVLPAKGKLFRLAVTLLNSRPEAEDAVQDVYLKLWNMRSKLAQYTSVEALAVTMTKNLCIDKLRSYQHRNQNANGLEKVTLSSSDRYDPAQQLERNESMLQLHEIINRLPEQQRMVLHLRDIEHYSYDEIESMTNMTRNNIRVTLSRARKGVREEYIKTYNHE